MHLGRRSPACLGQLRWIGGIEPGLIDRPEMTLQAILALLLSTLALGRIDEEVLGKHRSERPVAQEDGGNQKLAQHCIAEKVWRRMLILGSGPGWSNGITAGVTSRISEPHAHPSDCVI